MHSTSIVAALLILVSMLLGPVNGISTSRCGFTWTDANKQCRPSCTKNYDCGWTQRCYFNLAQAPCTGWSKSRCGVNKNDANSVNSCPFACTKDADCNWNGGPQKCYFNLDTDVCSGENHGGWRNGWICNYIRQLTGLCPPP